MKTITIQFYKDDGKVDKKFTKVLFYGVYKDALKLYSKMVDIDPALMNIMNSKSEEVKAGDMKALKTFIGKEITMFEDISEFFANMFANTFTAKEFEQSVPADDAIAAFSQIIQLAKTGFQMGA